MISARVDLHGSLRDFDALHDSEKCQAKRKIDENSDMLDDIPRKKSRNIDKKDELEMSVDGISDDNSEGATDSKNNLQFLNKADNDQDLEEKEGESDGEKSSIDGETENEEEDIGSTEEELSESEFSEHESENGVRDTTDNSKDLHADVESIEENPSAEYTSDQLSNQSDSDIEKMKSPVGLVHNGDECEITTEKNDKEGMTDIEDLNRQISDACFAADEINKSEENTNDSIDERIDSEDTSISQDDAVTTDNDQDADDFVERTKISTSTDTDSCKDVHDRTKSDDKNCELDNDELSEELDNTLVDEDNDELDKTLCIDKQNNLMTDLFGSDSSSVHLSLSSLHNEMMNHNSGFESDVDMKKPEPEGNDIQVKKHSSSNSCGMVEKENVVCNKSDEIDICDDDLCESRNKSTDEFNEIKCDKKAKVPEDSANEEVREHTKDSNDKLYSVEDAAEDENIENNKDEDKQDEKVAIKKALDLNNARRSSRIGSQNNEDVPSLLSPRAKRPCKRGF